MRALVVVLALLALVAGAWFVRDWWLPPTDEPRAAGATPGQTPAAPGTQVAPAATATAATAAGSAADRAPAGAASAVAVQQQAERYIATLTEIAVEPVEVEKADHFITGEQMLSLVPQGAVERTTVRRMRDDPTLAPDTPITLVREAEQVERVTPERLIARSGGNLEMAINVLERDQVRATTVREVLEQARRSPDKPIDVVTRTEYYEQTTPAELAARNVDQQDETVRIIRRHHGLEASSVSDLVRAEGVGEDSLFYVRTVRPEDSQGIWGIVQGGIIDNFARGMAIRRGKEINVYKVDIPKDADERRTDASSSFLGKLIHQKSAASHVYNFNLNRMGRNPDRIYPGQEIVIIDFKPDELIDIYKYFVAQRG